MKSKSEITGLLTDIREGSGDAYDELFPLVYSELKKVAHSKLQKERADITLTETALVHEVYLKMVDQTDLDVENKNHFMAIAARSMRQILIDHARKKAASKRGGDQQDVTYIDELLKKRHQTEELLDLDEQLDRLAEFDERMAQVVILRFFGQMTVEATANVLNVSERTVKRDWSKARGWLYKELKN